MPHSAAISRPGEGLQFKIGSNEIRAALTDELTDGALFLGVHLLAPGFEGPPPHVHGSMDHVFYILEGEVRFKLTDEELSAAAGTAAYIPRGVVHAFDNPGAASARMIEFNVPGGFDRYYAELEKLFPPGAAVDAQKIGEVMARFDTRRA